MDLFLVDNVAGCETDAKRAAWRMLKCGISRQRCPTFDVVLRFRAQDQ